jgi:hypothetical protein
MRTEGDIEELGVSMREAYSSPDEFFVRTLTDPDLMQALSERRYRGQTLLERFKDWIKHTLFNTAGEVPSWLDAALLGTNDLLKAMKQDAGGFEVAKAYEVYRQRSRADSQESALFNRSNAVNFTLPEETITSTVIRKMQDKFKVLKDLQANIVKAGGND